MSDSLQTYGLQPVRLLCPEDSPGKKTEVGCHALLQWIFLTQGSNLCFSHLTCNGRRVPYHQPHPGSPKGLLTIYLERITEDYFPEDEQMRRKEWNIRKICEQRTLNNYTTLNNFQKVLKILRAWRLSKYLFPYLLETSFHCEI